MSKQPTEILGSSLPLRHLIGSWPSPSVIFFFQSLLLCLTFLQLNVLSFLLSIGSTTKTVSMLCKITHASLYKANSSQ